MATAEEGPVLAVAAHPREFAGLLRHASAVSPIAWPIRHSSKACISNADWILAANGEGPACASEAIRCALESSSPRAVLSTGFCGALDPALRAGDVWAADEVITPQGVRYTALAPHTRREARSGAVLSIARVAVTAREKSELRRAGAGVVEMEAGAVAEAARSRGIPFYCVRVVSDGAECDLPIDFNRFRNPDGRFDSGRLARNAASRPWIWPRLIRLALDASRASKQLGDYLADCRF